MAKGVHPDQGGRSFVFLTDGQCHIRQCLQHEACSKNTTLPSYYYRFFDIRKEFRKRYDAGPVANIKTMLDCILPFLIPFASSVGRCNVFPSPTCSPAGKYREGGAGGPAGLDFVINPLSVFVSL